MKLWPEFGWWRSWISWARFLLCIFDPVFWRSAYYSYQWESTKNPLWRDKMDALLREP